jgi:hypothetical protein
MDTITSYMQQRKIPYELAYRIRRFYKHYLTEKASLVPTPLPRLFAHIFFCSTDHHIYVALWSQTALDERNILTELSTHLRHEVCLHLIDDTVYGIALFQILQLDELAMLICILKPFAVNPGDHIVRAGEIGTEMYILLSGRLVAISDDGTPLRLLRPGDYFGELAALNIQLVRSASVQCVVFSECYSLSCSDLMTAFGGTYVIERLRDEARDCAFNLYSNDVKEDDESYPEDQLNDDSMAGNLLLKTSSSQKNKENGKSVPRNTFESTPLIETAEEDAGPGQEGDTTEEDSSLFVSDPKDGNGESATEAEEEKLDVDEKDEAFEQADTEEDDAATRSISTSAAGGNAAGGGRRASVVRGRRASTVENRRASVENHFDFQRQIASIGNAKCGSQLSYPAAEANEHAAHAGPSERLQLDALRRDVSDLSESVSSLVTMFHRHVETSEKQMQALTMSMSTRVDTREGGAEDNAGLARQREISLTSKFFPRQPSQDGELSSPGSQRRVSGRQHSAGSQGADSRQNSAGLQVPRENSLQRLTSSGQSDAVERVPRLPVDGVSPPLEQQRPIRGTRRQASGMALLQRQTSLMNDGFGPVPVQLFHPGKVKPEVAVDGELYDMLSSSGDAAESKQSSSPTNRDMTRNGSHLMTPADEHRSSIRRKGAQDPPVGPDELAELQQAAREAREAAALSSHRVAGKAGTSFRVSYSERY